MWLSLICAKLKLPAFGFAPPTGPRWQELLGDFGLSREELHEFARLAGSAPER
jgi:hypothetical protein